MFDFTDRVVLVTGAGGNLGRAVASRFRSAGARLALTDRREEKLRHAFADWLGDADHVLTHATDLGDPPAIEVLVAEVVRRFGRIDVLANVAGAFAGGRPVHETAPDEWEAMLSANARSAFLVSRAVAPVMLEQGAGAIVNVASRAGFAGMASAAAYSAAKAAVLRLTEALDAELKGAGVRANCVVPGTIDTPENRAAMPTADTSLWVTPEAIADVVLFLASEAARAVHGAAVPAVGLG